MRPAKVRSDYAVFGASLCSLLSHLACSFCLQVRLLHPDPLRSGKVWPAGQPAASKSQSLRLRDAPAGGRSAGPVQTEGEPAWNVTSYRSKATIDLLVCSCIYFILAPKMLFKYVLLWVPCFLLVSLYLNNKTHSKNKLVTGSFAELHTDTARLTNLRGRWI